RTGLGCDRRQRDFALHARHIELKQAAVLDDLSRDLIFARGENRKWNFLAAANFFDQREVRRGEHAEVLAVLLVDALDVLRNHQLDPGAQLRVRRLFAARSLAAPLSAHGGNKPAALDISSLYGNLVPGFQSRVWKLAQRLIK